MLHNPKEIIYRNIRNSAVTKEALFPFNRSFSPGNHSYMAVCSLVYRIVLDVIFKQANDSKEYKPVKASALQQCFKAKPGWQYSVKTLPTEPERVS